MEPVDTRIGESARIAAWQALGAPAVVDRVRFYDELIEAQVIRVADRFEPVWSALVTMLLTALHRPSNDREVELYVRERFARTGGETAALDLLALPLHRADNWKGHELSRRDAYGSRRAFVETFAPARIEALRAQIAAHRPRLVLAYGNVHGEWWRRLAGGPLELASERRCASGVAVRPCSRRSRIRWPVVARATRSIVESACVCAG